MRHYVAFRDIAEFAVVRIGEYLVYVESPRVRNLRYSVRVFRFVGNAVVYPDSLRLLFRFEIDGLEAVVPHHESFDDGIDEVRAELRNVGHPVHRVGNVVAILERILRQCGCGKRERVLEKERLVRIYGRSDES